MTTPSWPQVFAFGGLGISTALNTSLVVLDLAIGHYQAAALQSLAVAFCGTWLWLVPKVNAWLDAKLGEAIAERRISEIARAHIEQEARNGELVIGMMMPRSGKRAN